MSGRSRPRYGEPRGVLAVRTLDPPRQVLVNHDGPPAAVWTGRLYRWERHHTGWWGWARWETDHQNNEEGLVPAERLRPFHERPVQVHLGDNPGMPGCWCDGRLLGWRRRPGSQWEARVGIWGDRLHSGLAWYPIDRLREPDPSAGSEDTH